MKQKIINMLKVMLAILAVVVLLPGADREIYAEAEEKELKSGVEYYVGDTIKVTSDTAWVVYSNLTTDAKIEIKGNTAYVVPEPEFYPPIMGSGNWMVDYIFVSVEGNDVSLVFDDYYINKPGDRYVATGIRCYSGDGSKDSPFLFELIFEVRKFPLWIGGKQVTGEYLSNPDEGWSYEGDASAGTLKLSNANIKGRSEDYACIYVENEAKNYSLTIELFGTNYVNTEENIKAEYGISTYGLCITGEGKLIVEGVITGIEAILKVEKKSEIEANGGTHGVFAGKINISDSTVTATGEYGIVTIEDIEIKNSTVTANGSSCGIIVENTGFQLSISKSTVNAKATNDNGIAIQADDIVLDGVEITKPEDGKIDKTSTGSLERKTIYDMNDQVARDVTITTVNPSYSVVSGGNSTYTLGSNQDLVITIKRSINDSSCFNNFKSVETDGVALTKDEDYTAAKGSVILTLKSATLEKLSEGDHTVTVSFTDGKIETSLTVNKAAEPTPQPYPKPVTPYTIPKTGIE